MVAIKKYDYKKICDDLGYTYLYEKNPKLWLKDDDGFEHYIDRNNFSKGVKPNIKTALNKKEYFYIMLVKNIMTYLKNLILINLNILVL